MRFPQWCWLLPLLLSCDSDEGLSALVVTVLYPVDGTQRSVASGMQQGLLEARVGSDFDIEEHTPASEDEAHELLDEALAPRQGRRLVITGGGLYAAALDARNCKLNGTKVLQLEGKPRPCRTLRSVELRTFAPAFLAGVLALSAESVAPRRRAGVISGPPSPEIRALIDGFVNGAEFVGGHAQTLELETFDERELIDVVATRAQIRALAAAVDVIVVAGDAANDLVLDAVREHNEEQPDQPLYLIGIDADLSLLDAKLTLGSILRRFDNEVRSSILAAEVDDFSAGQVVRGFRDGQVELLINPAYAETALDSTPFEACDACVTLSDAVREAEPAATRAAAEE